MSKNNLYLIYLLIILTVIARMIPHPMNITPIGALALFSGAYLGRGQFILTPMIALFIGDALIGFYAPVVMVFVYIGFILSTLIGRGLLYYKKSVSRIGLSVCCGAVVFYLLSNFGMWLYAYPYTVTGLIQCYVAGLPLLKNSLIGDAFYVIVIFGTYELLKYSVNFWWQHRLERETWN